MLIYNVVYCYRYNYDHILHGHLELDGHISYTFIIMRPNILRSAVFALKAFVSCSVVFAFDNHCSTNRL